MPDNYDFTAGATPTLKTVCKDENGAIIPLSGKTVELSWYNADGIAVTKTMSVTDEANGEVEYKFNEADLFWPAITFEIKISAGSDVLYNLDSITWRIRKPIN